MSATRRRPTRYATAPSGSASPAAAGGAEGAGASAATAATAADARAVARRIADTIAGHTPRAASDGKGYCSLELGDGRAAFAGPPFGASAISETLRNPAALTRLITSSTRP